MPANMAVISIIRNTAKVIPINKREELASIIDQQLEADPQDAAVSHIRNCSWRLFRLLLAR